MSGLAGALQHALGAVPLVRGACVGPDEQQPDQRALEAEVEALHAALAGLQGDLDTLQDARGGAPAADCRGGSECSSGAQACGAVALEQQQQQAEQRAGRNSGGLCRVAALAGQAAACHAQLRGCLGATAAQLAELDAQQAELHSLQAHAVQLRRAGLLR